MQASSPAIRPVAMLKLRTLALSATVSLLVLAGCGGGGGGGSLPTTSGLRTTITEGTALTAEQRAAFRSAVDGWARRVNSNVAWNIRVEFRPLTDPTQTTPTLRNYSYETVYNALRRSRTSSEDRDVIEALQRPPTFALQLSRTRNNPNGNGSATPYTDRNGDANNSTLQVTNAQAKALGIFNGSSSEVDAVFVFDSDAPWSYRSSATTADQYDFVGYATREIGRAFGFVSGLDRFATVTQNQGPQLDSDFPYVTVLDLLRYSAKGTPDWTVDTRTKYLSFDGGENRIAEFSTGLFFGDNQPAGTWKPAAAGAARVGVFEAGNPRGRMPGFSRTDRKALDVIGWEF